LLDKFTDLLFWRQFHAYFLYTHRLI